MVRLPLLVVCLTVSAMAYAQDADTVLVIRNHRFEPSELRIPAGKKMILVISNQDATPEEFESHELNREKIVPANGKAQIYVGPLSPGRYPFFGEFNPKTAIGTIVAE